MEESSLVPAFADPRRSFDARVWLLALGTFAVGTDSFVVSGILNQVARDLAVDLDAAGRIVSSYSITYALSAPILAVLTARIRKDRLVVGTLVGFSVANALCALAPTYSVLLAARLLAGVAAGLYTPTAYSLAVSLAPARRKASALSAVALGITGSVLAGVPLGIVVGQHFGWHASFWLVGGLSMIAFSALAWRPPRALPVAATRASLAARFAPLFQGRALLALLPSLLMAAGISATYTYLGALLRERGFSTGAIAGWYVLVGAGGVTGTLSGGRLVDRFGAVSILAAFFLLGIADTSLFTASLGVPAALAATCFLLHVTMAGSILGQQRRLIGLAPAHTEVILALNNSCLYAGIAVGAAVGGGLLTQGYALGAIPYASSLLLVGALAALGGSLWIEQRAGRSVPLPRAAQASVAARARDASNPSSFAVCAATSASLPCRRTNQAGSLYESNVVPVSSCQTSAFRGRSIPRV
jgi:DHA1 family inner membrane transport protein